MTAVRRYACNNAKSINITLLRYAFAALAHVFVANPKSELQFVQHGWRLVAELAALCPVLAGLRPVPVELLRNELGALHGGECSGHVVLRLLAERASVVAHGAAGA